MEEYTRSDLEGRKCGNAKETKAHVALVCMETEGLGRRFATWLMIPSGYSKKCRRKTAGRQDYFVMNFLCHFLGSGGRGDEKICEPVGPRAVREALKRSIGTSPWPRAACLLDKKLNNFLLIVLSIQPMKPWNMAPIQIIKPQCQVLPVNRTQQLC